MSKIVTFEQAKRLGKHGFNESVNSGYIGYTKDGELVSRYQYSQDKEYQTIPCWIKAPTVCHALDWVREEKGIVCSVWFDRKVIMTKDQKKEHVFYYFGVFYSDVSNDINHFTERSESHPLAENELLTAVLKYLIEKEK